MRVVHFVQRYPPALGGSEAYFERLGRFLVSAGESVSVQTTTAIDLEAFWSPRGRCLPEGTSDEAGVTVRRHPLARWPGRRYILKALSYIPHRQLQALAMPCNPIARGMWSEAGLGSPACDLVHATAFPYAWPIVCGLRLARRRGVPFLLTPFLHLGDPDDPGDRTRRAYLSPALVSLLSSADRLFVQTEGEHAAALRVGVSPEKLVLLGMGVDPADCTGGRRDATRHAWGIAPDQVVVGHLANNSMEKGTVDLLRAAERTWQSGCRFRVVLAGPEMPNFTIFWEGFSRQDAVLRLGVLTAEQKRDFYSAIDVFALPSRSDSFGLVLLEAWANGVPNLAYRAGGIADVIRHEDDGLLVRCGDVEALASALGWLAADSSLRTKLGQAGRERTHKEFRWQDKLERVRAVYYEAIAAPGAKKRPASPHSETALVRR
jgi:glycosyltransferase involved in cell wall biosynthesis